MKGKLTIILLVIVCLTMARSVSAEVLCIRASGKVVKSKVALGNALLVTSSCPRGYKEVFNTEILQGPDGATGAQGPKGDTGLTGAQGDQGPKGDKGATGEQGAQGERGPSAFDTIPSGTTVRGVAAVGDAALYPRVAISFPAPIPQAITLNDVIIARTSAFTASCSNISTCLDQIEIDKDHTQCTGNADLPTAPAGKVCIYPITWDNRGATWSEPVGGTSSIYGFQFRAATYASHFDATWAYTAP